MEWPNLGVNLSIANRSGQGLKRKLFALHFSSCFVFLIIPLMHEYILIIKDFVNTEILRANPEMTSVVCFRTFTAELVPLSCV